MADAFPLFNLKDRPPAQFAVTSIKVVAVDPLGRIALELRDGRHDDPGQFNLPGGKLEGDETYLQGCRREIREELCVKHLAARRLHYLTHYTSQKPEGEKLNVLVCWQVPDVTVFQQGDGGPIVFVHARDVLENKKIIPWVKPKTQLGVELSIALGLAPYVVPRHAKRPRQLAATRRALAARNKLILKNYDLS